MPNFSFSNWIFDLDFTLYQTNKPKSEFTYDDLHYNPRLINNLQNVSGRKILFTNANLMHTLSCIRIMKLEKVFHKISCRELSGLKPLINSYLNLYKICNIKRSDSNIFFEDTIENLIQAKKFGWTTVLISDNLLELQEAESIDEIDFSFPNIISALIYFNGN